jgi:hypothetical protein
VSGALIASVAYSLVVLCVFRPLARSAIEALRIGDLEWGDVVMGSFGALAAALVWPIAMPFVLLAKFSEGPEGAARLLAGESAAKKARRVEFERAEREMYIRRLERELQVHPD